jgi:hypothetical protein
LYQTTVLAWADAFQKRHGRWPKRDSGEVPECPGTTWHQIDHALQDGFRGLRGGSSLAQFLAMFRGARHQGDLPRLSVRRILELADLHCKRTGHWPAERGGAIADAPGETWRSVSAALREGGRGLPGGSSLPKLLEKHRERRNRGQLSQLSARRILQWADAYHSVTGNWPTSQSGPIAGANGETWRGIHNALVRGSRGLPAGTTLADFLAEHRGFRNVAHLPKLTVGQILQWADEHFARYGQWPNLKSGAVAGTSETWVRINDALRQGFRGLPGGTSLRKLLRWHRSTAGYPLPWRPGVGG